uniref:Acetylglucosaminyltransferase, putative n=1 Tax=Arundo donax TaxID=35708 RepID=A0A0A8YRE7_ARUDO
MSNRSSLLHMIFWILSGFMKLCCFTKSAWLYAFILMSLKQKLKCQASVRIRLL